MTQNTLSVNRKHGSACHNTFLWRELLSGRIPLLLWTVILFMVLPVFSLQLSSNLNTDFVPSDSRILQSIASTLSCAMFFMIGAGVVSGILVFSIFHNKRSAYFYLSLPLRRNHLFLTRLLSCSLPPVAAYLLNLLVSLIIFSANPLIPFAGILPVFLKLCGQTLLLFVWSFSGTVLAASFTSRGFAAAMLSAWVFGAIPAYYLSMRSVFMISAPDAFFRVFNNTLIYGYLSPLGRAVLLSLETGGSLSYSLYGSGGEAASFYPSLAPWEIPVILLVSLVMLFTAMLVTRRRPAENAGESAAFPRFGEFLKFTALIPGGILFGLFFYLLFDRLTALFLGTIWGIFVVFLILNLLIYRSGKKLFVNVKFAILVTALTLVLLFALLALGYSAENRIFDKQSTAQIYLSVGKIENLRVDPKESGELLGILNRLDTTAETTENTTENKGTQEERSISARITLVPKFGISLQKRYVFVGEEDIGILNQAISGAENGEGLLGRILPKSEAALRRYNLQLLGYDGNLEEIPDSDIQYAQIAEIAKRRTEEFKAGESGGFAVGTLAYSVSSKNSFSLFDSSSANYYIELPLYPEDLALFGKEFDFDTFCERLYSVEVRPCDKYDNAESITTKDRQQIRKLLEASTGVCTDSLLNPGTTCELWFFVGTANASGAEDIYPLLFTTLRPGEKLLD